MIPVFALLFVETLKQTAIGKKELEFLRECIFASSYLSFSHENIWPKLKKIEKIVTYWFNPSQEILFSLQNNW